MCLKYVDELQGLIVVAIQFPQTQIEFSSTARWSSPVIDSVHSSLLLPSQRHEKGKICVINKTCVSDIRFLRYVLIYAITFNMLAFIMIGVIYLNFISSNKSVISFSFWLFLSLRAAYRTSFKHISICFSWIIDADSSSFLGLSGLFFPFQANYTK